MTRDGGEIPAQAHYMDGSSARIRPVHVRLSDAARPEDAVLILRDAHTVLERWALSDLRARRDQAKPGALVLTSASRPDARLMVQDPLLIRKIRDAAPSVDARDVAPGMLRKVMLWAGGAVAAIGLIVFVIVPAIADRLAPYIPQRAEKRLGDAAISQISWLLGEFGEKEIPFCEAPEGMEALGKMVARLTGTFETDYDLSIRVLDHPMPNAFAVPGGQVILFNGLLRRAGSPEQVAGVLGHEFGHVVNRDPMRLALRSAGTAGILGIILGDFTGGAFALLLAERLIAADYAQSAETASDQFAFEVMAKAGLPTIPFSNFFRDMEEEFGGSEGGLLSHLASHPDLGGRARAAQAADTLGGRSFEPVLTASEWAALRDICGGPKEDETKDAPKAE